MTVWSKRISSFCSLFEAHNFVTVATFCSRIIFSCVAILWFFLSVRLGSACNEVCYKFNLYSCKLSSIRAYIRQRMALALLYKLPIYTYLYIRLVYIFVCKWLHELRHSVRVHKNSLTIYSTRYKFMPLASAGKVMHILTRTPFHRYGNYVCTRVRRCRFYDRQFRNACSYAGKHNDTRLYELGWVSSGKFRKCFMERQKIVEPVLL